MGKLVAFLAGMVATLGIVHIVGQPEDTNARSVSEVKQICRELFKLGDKVNGMADWCYTDFKANDALDPSGLYVIKDLTDQN